MLHLHGKKVVSLSDFNVVVKDLYHSVHSCFQFGFDIDIVVVVLVVFLC